MRGIGRPRKSTRDAMICFDAQSLNPYQLAAKYNMKVSSVRVLLSRHGAQAVRKKHADRPIIINRNLSMAHDYEIEGLSLIDLAKKHGITRERVCQILRPAGIIESRGERNRIAREEAQAESQAIKAKFKADRAAKLAEVVHLVKQGYSINEAARRHPGLPKNLYAQAVKDAGVVSRHGRWRDQSKKVARARELRKARMSWIAISDQLKVEGFGGIYPAWVDRHCPDLMQEDAYQPRADGSKKPIVRANSKARKTRRIPKPIVNIDDHWTPRLITRLLRLWLGGATAQQIADIFGEPFTRSSILGKLNRLRENGQLTARVIATRADDIGAKR